jgi:hypothetical protein
MLFLSATPASPPVTGPALHGLESIDAAMLAVVRHLRNTATLPSGRSYTVKVSGVNGATGEALVEIYELP